MVKRPASKLSLTGSYTVRGTNMLFRFPQGIYDN